MDMDTSLRDLALLSARLTLGGTMAAHGAQKMFGTQGGPGLEGTAKMMESLGFRPGDRFAPALASAEMGSGMLIALGALGPMGPAVLLTVMLVAIETVHRPKGYFNQQGGYEMNAMIVMLAMLLANEGYGRISLDHLLGLRKRMRPLHGWLALAGGVAGALYMLAQRETAPRSTHGETASREEAESTA